eukprot:gene23304-30541_t
MIGADGNLAVRTLRVKRPDEADKQYVVSPSKPLLSRVKHNAYTCGDNSRNQLGQPGVAHVPEPVHVVGGPGGWAVLSYGGSHAAGLGCDGELWTWGSNNAGQCGQPDAKKSFEEPVKASTDGGEAVACGRHHTVAITEKDTLVFGSNEFGQLGLGAGAPAMRWQPTIVPALQGAAVTQVVCGAAHVVCVTSQSAVYSWGANDVSHLGLGDRKNRHTLTLLNALWALPVYSWGANDVGQLGLGDRKNRHTPTLVNALWALPVVQLAAGLSHSVALTTNGHMFTWGSNSYGQLGLLPEAQQEGGGRSSQEGSAARQAGFGRYVDCGYFLGLAALALDSYSQGQNGARVAAMTVMGVEKDMAEVALEETGNVGVEVATEWLFSIDQAHLQAVVARRRANSAADSSRGASDKGSLPPHGLQAGKGLLSGAGVVLAPKRVPLKAVVARRRANGATDSSCGASVKGCQPPHGLHAGGRLVSDAAVVLAPKRVPLKNVRQMNVGDNYTIAVTDEGLFSWGENTCGALGQGDFKHRDLPCKIEALDGCNIERVACGSQHSLFLSRTGAVYGCGECSSGQLTQRPVQMGVGERLATPVKLALPFGVSQQRLKPSSDPLGPGEGKRLPVMHDVVAGPSTSAFITRLPGDEPSFNQISLLS